MSYHYRECNGGTQCWSGLDSIYEEDEFNARLERMASLSPSEKRRMQRELKRREDKMAEEHDSMNRFIDSGRMFSEECRREEEE